MSSKLEEQAAMHQEMKGNEAPMENNQTGAKEDPFRVGRARQDAIVASLKATKEKVGGWFTRAGSSIGKFFTKVRKDGIPALLQPDVEIEKFDNYTDKKAFEAGAVIGSDWAEGINDIKKGTVATGEAIAKGTAAVGRGLNKGGDALMDWGDRTGDKLNKAGDKTVEFISDKVLRGGDATVEAFRSMGRGLEKGTDKMADFLTEKQDLLADKMLALSEKTGKSIDKFKGGVAKRFNNVKSFGQESVARFEMWNAARKQRNRDEKNAKLQAAMLAKHNAEIAQLQLDLENNKQGEEWARNQMEAYQRNQEIIQKALDEKMGYFSQIDNLEQVA